VTTGGVSFCALFLCAATLFAGERTVLIIAHRGACGYRPEHTLEAYKLAIEQGADFIEPDLVATKDGQLISRHENELSDTTDVADHPEFQDKKTTKLIDGKQKTGWFSEDFTLAEIKTLRAKERLPKIRNTKYDGKFEIATFKEIIALAKQGNVGVYPETKHPTHFAKLGFNLGEMLIKELVAANFTDPKRVFIQSFEVNNLIELKTKIMPRYKVAFPLIQLTGGLLDRPADRDTTTYGEMLSDAGLREMRKYADGIGPSKNTLLPRKKIDGKNGYRTQLTGKVHPFLARAKRLGFLVHTYTVRAEKPFLALDENGKPQTVRDEIRQLIAIGVDGIFIEQPDEAFALMRKKR